MFARNKLVLLFLARSRVLKLKALLQCKLLRLVDSLQVITFRLYEVFCSDLLSVSRRRGGKPGGKGSGHF